MDACIGAYHGGVLDIFHGCTIARYLGPAFP
jgi:hypothetical protein